MIRSTLALLLTLTPWASAEPVDYNRDVRPILAEHCFRCHGQDEDKRKAGLRLDVRESALAKLDSGVRAIVPGDTKASELVVRITESDPLYRMPPKSAKKRLTPAQIDTLTRWVREGAKYARHWAFVPPRRPTLPLVKERGWPANPIDSFVLARLEKEGLRPSPAADPYMLVRRVYLDLIGLPPTPAEADEWVGRMERSPTGYRELVDHLLASKQYGERWARPWLDLARYSDTNGYEKDRPRSMWPFRDWVIRAINEDMPFDRFSIEQLAGDMLPSATIDQRVATGFHRNTMLNEEGGIDPLEFRFYAMVDRVATTGLVWMGLTTGCAQCHTHKYDPITHTDYYRFLALLNNAEEPDLILPDPDIAERRRAIQARIGELEAKLVEHFPRTPDKRLEDRFAGWLETERERAVAWQTIRPTKLETNLPKLEVLDDGSIFSTGDITKRDVFRLVFDLTKTSGPVTALRLEVLPDDRLPARGPGRAFYEGRKGDFFLSEVKAKHGGKPVRFATASHTYGKLSIGGGGAAATNVLDGNGSTGWSTARREGERHQLVLVLAESLAGTGTLEVEMLFERHFAASLGRFRFSVTSSKAKVIAREMPEDVERILASESDPAKDERAVLLRHFLRVAPETAEARKKIDALRKTLPDFPIAMVMRERTDDNPRKTHRHHRGEYLASREEVTPGILDLFRESAPEQHGPTNRLELARWLVSESNPLVGRVTVNRAWRAFFGAGLVRTAGDFGTQAEAPTHPDLLDWLAVEFMDKGWSMKPLHRLIVTSVTYRQSSSVTEQARRIDPDNRLLARGPRFRVDAEVVRDNMLSVAGLRTDKMFGPSVYPPQPAEVTALAYGNTRWPTSTGPDRYRRSLYTFSKRTAPFAAYTVFDGPTGENCIPKRNRSNTPLQALTLLNDAMFTELAKATARHVMDEAATPRETAERLFRAVLTRPPTPAELTMLTDYQRAQLQRLRRGELDPRKMLDDKAASPEWASWYLVARVLMNLDETITKR